jgi:hypothetical protein
MYSYGLLIEVEPARQLEQRKIALYAQVELLVADAARYDLALPDGLRERAAECRGDLRELESVRAALEGVLLVST